MKRRVAIKNRRQYRYPCTDDIMYIDSDKHNVTLHLSDGSEIITVDKLGEIEKRINEKRFLRCHQSYLVNMDYIKDVEDDFIWKMEHLCLYVFVGGKKYWIRTMIIL